MQWKYPFCMISFLEEILCIWNARVCGGVQSTVCIYLFFLHVVKSVITCHSLCVPECSFFLALIQLSLPFVKCTAQLISRLSQVTSEYFQLSSLYAYTFQWKYKEISYNENQRLMENSCLSLIFLIDTHAYELNKYGFCLLSVRLHCPQNKQNNIS